MPPQSDIYVRTISRQFLFLSHIGACSAAFYVPTITRQSPDNYPVWRPVPLLRSAITKSWVFNGGSLRYPSALSGGGATRPEPRQSPQTWRYPESPVNPKEGRRRGFSACYRRGYSFPPQAPPRGGFTTRARRCQPPLAGLALTF